MNTKTAIIFGPEGPDSSAEGVVTAKFIKMLQNKGWIVIWIYHTNISYYCNHSDTIDSNFIGIKNSSIQRLSQLLRHVPILKYIYHLDSILWCYKAYRKARKLQSSSSIDYVFSRIMPQYGHLPALLFSMRTNTPWIANWSDPMPRSKAPAPYGQGVDSPISKFQQYYLRKICKYAAGHTFPSEYLKNFYLKYLPAKEQLCFTLPHIIDKDIIPTEEKHKTLRLSHIGGGLIQRNPTLFFNALKATLDKIEYNGISLEVNFIGPIEGGVDSIAKETGVAHVVHFTGKLPYNKALTYIESADILLIIEAPMTEGIFLPSKVADILGYHKPMFSISPSKGVLKDLISQFKGGIVVDCLSSKSIQNGLEQLFTDWETNKLKTSQYETQKLYHEFSEQNVWNQLKIIINHL